VAIVFIPTLLRPSAGGAARVEVPGATVRQVIENLDRLYPGIQAKLVEGERLRPNLSVAVDGEVSPMGLMEPVDSDSEVHFVTAISGGRE
jgi:molybdopterin converting factor small subunit